MTPGYTNGHNGPRGAQRASEGIFGLTRRELDRGCANSFNLQPEHSHRSFIHQLTDRRYDLVD